MKIQFSTGDNIQALNPEEQRQKAIVKRIAWIVIGILAVIILIGSFREAYTSGKATYEHKKFMQEHGFSPE